MVVEEIPLALELDNRMVVGPALGLRLLHYLALEHIRTHRLVTHTVSQTLAVLLDPREGVIVYAVALEQIRTLLEAVRNLAHCNRLGIKLEHIVLEPCYLETAA